MGLSAICCSGTTLMAPIRPTGASPFTSTEAFSDSESLAIRADFGGQADPVAAVSDAFEQEETIIVGPRRSHDFAGLVDQLDIQPFEAVAAVTDDGTFDVAGADEPYFDVGADSGAWNDDLQSLLRRQHRVVEARRVDADRHRHVIGEAGDHHSGPGVGTMLCKAGAGGDQRALLKRFAEVSAAIVVEVAVDAGVDGARIGKGLARQLETPRLCRAKN